MQMGSSWRESANRRRMERQAHIEPRRVPNRKKKKDKSGRFVLVITWNFNFLKAKPYVTRTPYKTRDIAEREMGRMARQSYGSKLKMEIIDTEETPC
jgi:hypothetical protein